MCYYIIRCLSGCLYCDFIFSLSFGVENLGALREVKKNFSVCISELLYAIYDPLQYIFLETYLFPVFGKRKILVIH